MRPGGHGKTGPAIRAWVPEGFLDKAHVFSSFVLGGAAVKLLKVVRRL
jgi:hypothetical protein